MKTYTLSLTANEEAALIVDGTYFRILNASGSVFVGMDSGPLMSMAQGIGYASEGSARFSRLRLLSATSQTIDIAAGVGRVDDSRLSLTGAVDVASAASIVTTADVSLAATATTLIKAATTLRKEIMINNLGSVTLRIGDSNAGATRGQPLEPGQSITLNTRAAVYGYNPGAAAVTASVLELI